MLHSPWNFSLRNLLFPDVNVLSSLPFDNVPVESNILRGLEHFTVLQHNQYVLLAAEAKTKACPVTESKLMASKDSAMQSREFMDKRELFC